jgi:nucleotide-binding universal stress UspA family protein
MDFSDCSKAALIYACRLVEGTRTPLLLLHVIHDDVRKPGLYRDPDSYRMARPITDIAAEMLESMLSSLCNQNPELLSLQAASTLLISGLPGRRIIEVAEREQAAMIIMGTHGRSGFAHLLQGSVAEYVTKYASVPVMTLKNDNNLPLSLNLSGLGKTGVSAGV